MTEETNSNSSSSNPDEPETADNPNSQAATATGTEKAEPVDLAAEVERLKTEILYARAETENVRRRLEIQASLSAATVARSIFRYFSNSGLTCASTRSTSLRCSPAVLQPKTPGKRPNAG